MSRSELRRINGTRKVASYAVLVGTAEVGIIDVPTDGGLCSAYGYGGVNLGDHATVENAQTAIVTSWEK